MKIDQVLDAKGLACPMPIVKTKKGNGYFNNRSSIRSANDR